MATDYVVTTSPDQPVEQTARALGGAGCTIRQVLGEIGLVLVTCEAGALAKLRGLPGVAAIEPDAAVDIGPPDAPTTW